MRFEPNFQQQTSKRFRLRVALLISALVHGALLLWVRFDYFDSSQLGVIPVIEVTLTRTAPIVEQEPVDAKVKEEPVEEEPTVPTPEKEPTQQIVTAPDEPTPATSASNPVIESLPNIDWDDVVRQYSEEATVQKAEQERHREVMWRKTYSVMFAPPEEWLIEDQPYLPDLKFDEHEFRGLGIQIGENCFLGIPVIDPETIDSDAVDWSEGGSLKPSFSLITCGFGG